jgi:hypothetical protein
VVSQVHSTYSSLMFAIVYLLYPGTSRVVFEYMRCRTVAVDTVWLDHGVVVSGTQPRLCSLIIYCRCSQAGVGHSLLERDMRVTCWEGQHAGFAAVAAVFVLVCPPARTFAST